MAADDEKWRWLRELMRKGHTNPWIKGLPGLQRISETPHHTLCLQHYALLHFDLEGNVIKRTTHNWDVVKPKPSAPQALDGVEGWERILEDPVDLEGLKYRKVVQVMYRNKGTGEIVSREVVVWQPSIFPGGVICRPHVHYSDGSKALLYLEEWRRETNKIAICFPEGMMDYTSNGSAEKPLVAALRELKEEGGVEGNDEVKITLLDHWKKDGLLSGMGQDRHFFRVAIYGLEKGFVPIAKPDEDEQIVVKLVPIDKGLKHHFLRYTEENGYVIGPEFQEEIDWITGNCV